LVLIAGTADGRPIVFEHRLEDLQAGRDGELHQPGARIDEEINKGQMALNRGIDLVRPIDCGRLSFHGGSLLGGFRLGLVTGRLARPVRSRRFQISTATGTSPKLKAVKLSQLKGVEVQAVADALEIHPFMLSRWRKEARDGVLRGRVSLPKVVKAPPAGAMKRFQALRRAHALLQEEHALLKTLIRFTSARKSTSSCSSSKNARRLA
jgi:transposase